MGNPKGTGSVGPTRPRRKLRVKTGCHTCRIRHIKCDEGKPACNKCVSTGRVCDGYGIWGGGGNSYASRFGLAVNMNRQPNNSVIAVRPYLRDPGVSPSNNDESLCFEFFRLRLSERLAGVFYSQFWDKTVFQLSAKEPAVFHALIALSSLQRRQELDAKQADGSSSIAKRGDQWQRFGLQQYNKAIESLQLHFAARDHYSIHVALAACVLFTCSDIVRGAHFTASSHVTNAINILASISVQPNASGVTPLEGRRLPLPRTVHDQLLDRDLLETVLRMNIPSLFFGHPVRRLLTILGDCAVTARSMPDRFENLGEMRKHLDIVLNFINRPPQKRGSHGEWVDMTQDEYEDQKHFLWAALEKWLRSYKASSNMVQQTVSSRLSAGVKLLRIYHILATIMLAVRERQRSPSAEMMFDSHEDKFDDIIRRVDQLSGPFGSLLPAAGHDPLVGSRDLTADMGVIPLLTFTALKCRNPIIRRKAARSMMGLRHQEGVWNGTVAGVVVTNIINLEEGGFFDDILRSRGEDPGSPSPFSTAGLPPLPLDHRFAIAQVTLEDDGGDKTRVVYQCRRLAAVLQAEHDVDDSEEIAKAMAALGIASN